MTVTPWQRLDMAGRAIAPMTITAGLALVAMVPVQVPFWQPVAPLLPLMSVYYWAIHRPDLMSLWALFLLGVIQDLLAGTPIGLTSLTYLLCHGFVVSQSGFFLANSFVLLWFGFVVVVFSAEVLQWLVFSALHTQVLRAGAALFQALLTLGLFPVFAWAFTRVHRAFLNQG